MKFFTFAASHRKESLNRILSKEVASIIRHTNHTVVEEHYDALDMPIYNDEICSDTALSATTNRFAECAAAADGIIVASPEYNWSYPGSLKNIIDWTSRLSPCPLEGKTVLLASATPSPRGGINGLMHLRSPFESVRAIVFPRVFTLGSANFLLADGRLKDERQKHILTSLVTDYIAFTQKLCS